jgi:hypothetical protein
MIEWKVGILEEWNNDRTTPRNDGIMEYRNDDRKTRETKIGRIPKEQESRT